MGKDKEEKQLVILGGQNGFNCPVCHKFIPVSAKDLFQKVAIKCPSCSLSLTIDRKSTMEEKDEIDNAFTKMMLNEKETDRNL